MSDLESELRNMQPAASEQSEAELMYQCGWEAALAQQEAAEKILPPSVVTAAPNASKQAFSLANFGGGTLFGAAACLFLMLGAGLWSEDQTLPGPSDNLAGNPPTHTRPDKPEPQPDKEHIKEPEIPSFAGTQVVNSMREFAEGFQFSFAMPDLNKPILLANKKEVSTPKENPKDDAVAGPLSVFGNKELSIRAQSSLAGNPSWLGLGGF